MTYSFDSDQDDQNPYENDSLIQKIKKYSKNVEQDWQNLGSYLDKKLDKIVFPKEKLDYLIAASDAAGYSVAFLDAVVPIVKDLYVDLPTTDERLKCAIFVANYSSHDEGRHEALDLLEENYNKYCDPKYKLTALGLLLNDDRPHSDEVDKVQKQAAYFAEWKSIFDSLNDTDKARDAYEALEPLRLYNIFKPLLVEQLVEYLPDCTDPKIALEIIMFCGRQYPSDDNGKSYEHLKSDKDYFPFYNLYDWEMHFLDASLNLMNKDGYKKTAQYLNKLAGEHEYRDWIEDAFVTINFLNDPSRLQDANVLSDLLFNKNSLLDQNIKSPTALLKKKKTYIGLAEKIHEDALSDGLVNNLYAYVVLKDTYTDIMKLANQEKNSDTMKKNMYDFARSFILTAATGDKKFNQEKLNEINMSKHGKNPVFSLARKEINKNVLISNLIEDQIDNTYLQKMIQKESSSFRNIEIEKGDKDAWKNLKDEITEKLDYNCYPEDYTIEWVKTRTKVLMRWFEFNKDGECKCVEILNLTPKLN